MTRLNTLPARYAHHDPKAKAKKQSKKQAKKPKAPSKLVLNVPQWDAKIIPGGVWIQVPFVPPSLNVWKKWHMMQEYNYRQQLYAEMWKLVKYIKIPQFKRATIQFIYYHGTNRRRDKIDNYAPKFLMDALVVAGVLEDDNDRLVDVSPVKMDFDAERPRTEIFVWGKE